VAHHTAEDRALWPALREAVAASPDQVAIADALEDEHPVMFIIYAVGAIVAALTINARLSPDELASH
jgi:hypothetical protein